MATLGDRAGTDNEERTGAFIQAADAILEESGLEALTIRAVLTRSGMARRAFYEQFQGKDDLVLAVFERTLREAANYFRNEAAQAADPLDALRTIVTSLVVGQLGSRPRAAGRRSAALSREHLRLADSRPQDLQAALSPLLVMIAEVIAAGVARGQMRACEPVLQANFVYNFVSATIHMELLMHEGGNPDLQRREQLSDAIWEFCRRAVIA